MKASGTFKPTNWVDTPREYSGLDLVETTTVFEITGEIEGKASVHYLMFGQDQDPNDPHAGSATYAGFIRFDGSIHGKRGAFVLQDLGHYADHKAESTLQIIPRSGSHEFASIEGTGRYVASPNEIVFELDYELM